jgi:hypothetical protein
MQGRNLTLFVASGLLAACSQAAKEPFAGDPPYVSLHSTQQLMQHVVDPAAQAFWHSVQYVSDENGQREIVPTTDEDWQRTQAAAATVAESGNLLMMPIYSKERGPDWMDFSKGLAEMGRKAEQAAADRDVDAVFAVGGDLYNVCSACHMAYMPKEQAANANAVNDPTED